MKLGVIGDTHFGIKGFNQEFFNSQKEFLLSVKNRLKETDKIIQLGDLFDNRKVIDNKLFQDIVEFMEEFTYDLPPFYTLIGNHDIYYKDTLKYSPLYILNKILKNFTLIDTQTIEDNIAYVPWLLEGETFLPKILNSKYIFGHFEFQGFEILPGIMSKTGITIPKTNATIISGHFHTPSRNHNVIYTGTPYQLNWADSGSRRGIYILDTETGDMEFIENKISKRFIKIFLDNEITSNEDIELSINNLKGHYIKVYKRVEEKPKHIEFLKMLYDNDINFTLIDNTIKQEEIEIDEKNIKTPEQLLYNIIDDDLHPLMKNIIQEAKELIKD